MNNKCSLKFGFNVFRLLSRAGAFPRPSRADATDEIFFVWLGEVRQRGSWHGCVCGGVLGVMSWRTSSRLPSPPSAVIALFLSSLFRLLFQPARSSQPAAI